MKKHTYQRPRTEAIALTGAHLLAGSSLGSNVGIDFGGEDTGGTLDPAAPQLLPDL